MFTMHIRIKRITCARHSKLAVLSMFGEESFTCATRYTYYDWKLATLRNDLV